jgi:hypothetical protein
LCVRGTFVQAQTTNSTITVDVSRPSASIAAICGGQQIEEFNLQFEGGLYARLINNRSFEEIDPNWRHFTYNLTTSGITSVTGTTRFVIYTSTAGNAFFDVVTVLRVGIFK